VHYIYNNDGNEIQIHSNSSPYFSYCNIEGGMGSYSSNNYINIIDILPFFIDPDNANYQLSEISMSINSGTPDTSGLDLPQIDLVGNPRIYQGVSPRIDLGAYEFQGEPSPFYSDFQADCTYGAIPLIVQFTTEPVGNILTWEWDFNNDGIVDSYEQNPQWIYDEIGLYSVALTISNTSHIYANLKEDYIEVGDTYSFYEEKFRFNKINFYDELSCIQVLDIDNDGVEEIYANFINTDQGYCRVIGINNNGQIIKNIVLEYGFVSELYLFEMDGEYFICTVSKINSGGYYWISTKIIEFNTLTVVSDYSYQVVWTGDIYDCSIYSLAIESNNGYPDIYVGFRFFASCYYGGFSYSKLLKLKFDGANLMFSEIVEDCGRKTHPYSNLTFGYYHWWDDMGEEDELAFFNRLNDASCFYTLVNPSIYIMMTSDDSSFVNYGTIIYFAQEYSYSKMICFTDDYNVIEWELPITLHTGSWNAKIKTCSCNTSYEGNDYFLIFFNYLDHTVNILNRLTGEIVYSEYSSLEPFSIQKTASDKLILFENNYDEYIIYTNDPNYYVGIDDPDYQLISNDYNLKNFPNPVTSSTTISFSLPANAQKAELKIYNIKGQLVKTFVPKTSPKGVAINFVWDGKDNHDKTVANGVYFYKLETSEKQITKKMVLMK